MSLYRDREEAGQKLAEALSRYADRDDVAVLALPRGGVPVASEVARRLRAPLDIMIVRKLGTPGQPELAMGAIASGGARIVNDDVVRALHISEAALDAAAQREEKEVERRERAYRGDHPPLDVRGRCVIVVDDGLATGATMLAAVAALKARGPERVIVAVPTAAADSCERLRTQTDEVIALATPEPYFAVGVWYENFAQTSDDEVRALLDRARREQPVEPRTPEAGGP